MMKISKKVISILTALAMSVPSVGVLAADIVTSGSSGKQDVIIMDNETVLIKDTDYTLEYKDNVNVGEATVIIHFIGNYSGEREQTFNIKRKPSTGGGGGGGGSYSKPTVTATPIPTAEPTSPMARR